MELQRSLKELRARKNWTQAQAAKAYGISPTHYQRIEKDINALNNSSISLIMRIAKIHNIEISNIFLG